MSAASTSAAGAEAHAVARKPSKLLARSNTLHRSPHGHSGSGAGLWLANSPSPDSSTFAIDKDASPLAPLSLPSNTTHDEATDTAQATHKHAKKVYHFSAQLARASFGAPLALGASSLDSTYVVAPASSAGRVSSDSGDVDLDLSFDYISRFDRESSSEAPDSSGSALETSHDRNLPLRSHFSPDDTPESILAPAHHDASHISTPPRPSQENSNVATADKSLSASPDARTSPSPNSKLMRSMRQDADWDKRRKAPPAPLDLTPGSEAKRQRQLAMTASDARAAAHARPAAELRPSSGELVGQSIFSPITPATAIVPPIAALGSHPQLEPLPITPLSATRRGAAINRLPDNAFEVEKNQLEATPDSAAVRRAASTSAARIGTRQSSEALSRTPTASHSTASSAKATPVQARRARSHSTRSFRASASLASLGPPPFPPPNEPLPSPALSPSFHDYSLPSTSAYHTAIDAGESRSNARTARPSVSSVDFSEPARSIRSRTTHAGRSSLDSFRTALSDGMTGAASSGSIHGHHAAWTTEGLPMPPPLPPLERYEALFPSGNGWTAPAPPTVPAGLDGATPVSSNDMLGIGATSSINTASTLTSVPMTLSSTVGSATTMTWSMSDRSTPSTHHSPLTPFTPVFAEMIVPPGATTKTQMATATHAEMPSLGTAATDMDTGVGGRGARNTEQWILTQRQRKALLQQQELAADQQMLDAGHEAMRLSIRADERPSRGLNSRAESAATKPAQDGFGEERTRQDSRSTESTDDDHPSRLRQTLVISTVSTPDERDEPFRFGSTQTAPSLLAADNRAAMERAASHSGVLASTAAGPVPMTRNRSGTNGPWPQSPLLLDPKSPAASPAPTTIVHSNYATPQLESDGHKIATHASGDESTVQGLGLDLEYPAQVGGSAMEAPKGFAPITTDLLRQASRCMTRFPHDSASPHLSITMSPDAEALGRSRSKSREAVLTRTSRHDLHHAQLGLGLNFAGPSPVLPNDCRSPRTASGLDKGSAAPAGLDSLLTGPVPASAAEVIVNRAHVGTDRALLHSQSIASSISAFAYNPTPAGPNTADANRSLQPPRGKGSNGWRLNPRRSRDHGSMLAAPMRGGSDADVKFVNIDLDDGGLETEVALDRGDARRAAEQGKAGQWVSKLWTAVSSPRRTSFNLGAAVGDQSVDLELANTSEEAEHKEAPAPLEERKASRGSFRPLSLVEKRQSSGRYNVDLQRQRFRSPTPGEEDEVAEKDARAVALRLLAGSPRLPAPAEAEAMEACDPPTQDGADVSAEEREKERMDALKKLRRMSAVERQRKRNSGIGYIVSAQEPTRLPYVHDGAEGEAHRKRESILRQGGLSRTASLTSKRMSMTTFGGKERADTVPATAADEPPQVGAERAWLDALRSPRVAESPSGFTPRMAFEPHDWGANERQEHTPANHIPLLLAGSAAPAQRAVPAPAPANGIGMTVSELDRARDEMRRLAGQGATWNDAHAQHAGETFHTPMPDTGEMADPWSYSGQDAAARNKHEHRRVATTELGDFGISPEKQPRLHRRTRTARFAVDDDDDEQPAVSIFTRAASQHRARASGSFSMHHGAGTQPPLTAAHAGYKRSRRGGEGGGLFATPASLLEGTTPSKNMFWAGFLGMPWLWMIGGWYLTPDGQLRHPSSDTRARDKVDVWQHEPSMHPHSASSSPNPGSSSTFVGGASYEHDWTHDAGASQSGLGFEMSGMPSGMSYAPSSVGTSNSARTTSSNANQPPPSKVRKSKTRSLGSLLDTNPQVSFFQSPVRAVPEAAPGSTWHGRAMEPVEEVEEPRRSRLFAAPAEQFDLPSEPAFDGMQRSNEMAPPKVQGYQVAVATRSAVATPWRDLERYVLLNRVAAILSGVLVFAGFTGAVYAVVANF